MENDYQADAAAERAAFEQGEQEDSRQWTAELLAESIKAEVLRLVAYGTVPADVPNFAALHDHVDANCLGDSEAIYDAYVTESATDAEHVAKLDKVAAVMDPAQAAVDRWLRSGGIAAAAAAT